MIVDVFLKKKKLIPKFIFQVLRKIKTVLHIKDKESENEEEENSEETNKSKNPPLVISTVKPQFSSLRRPSKPSTRPSFEVIPE